MTSKAAVAAVEKVERLKARPKRISSRISSQLHNYREVNKQIVKANPAELILMIRSGLDARMLAGGSEFYNIPSQAFSRIVGVPVATANRKMHANVKLGVAESERLTRIALVEAEAEEVFGSEAVAKQWLLAKNHALGDSPLELMDTEIGANEVKKVLASIAYGGAV